MIAQLIDGPLWTLSLTLFLVGVTWRIVMILKAGVATDFSIPRKGGGAGALRAIFSRFVPERTVRRRGRVQVIAGYMFHLGLFALLFLARPHVDFIAERITGFHWWSMPYWAFIVAAEIAFAGLIMLWLYRLLNPVTRLLSSADDYAGTVLVFLVMLTGCLALAQSVEALRLIHLALVEVLLIYFPFSNLMHAFTFVFSRGYTGSTMGRKGIRA